MSIGRAARGLAHKLTYQVEINVAVISASAPSLRPLVKSLMGGPSEKSGYGSQVHQTARPWVPPRSSGRDAEITTDASGSDTNGNESDENIGTKSEIVGDEKSGEV